MEKKVMYGMVIGAIAVVSAPIKAVNPANVYELHQLVQAGNAPQNLRQYLKEHAPSLLNYIGYGNERFETALYSTIAQANKPVIVKFYANWCGPCKRLKPIMEEVARMFSNEIIVINVELDNNTRKLLGAFDARGIPTIVFFKDGKKVDQYTGALNQQQLVQKIQRLV